MDGARRESENGSSLIDASSSLSSVDPFSQPLHSIESWNFHLLSALMFLVTSLSLFENFTVILITVKFKQLRQPLNYVIVNLSVADFFVSLVGGTISFLTNLKGYFYMGHWACVLEGFAVTFFGKWKVCFFTTFTTNDTCIFSTRSLCGYGLGKRNRCAQSTNFTVCTQLALANADVDY